MTSLPAAHTVSYSCWPCYVVSATHTYGLISGGFRKRSCANSGRSAGLRTLRMLSLRGTKRKWQGNWHSVSIAIVAQALLFIPRLMGWSLELKMPDWEKHVLGWLTTRVASRHTEKWAQNSMGCIYTSLLTSSIDLKLLKGKYDWISQILMEKCCHWNGAARDLNTLKRCRMWVKLVKAVFENGDFC